MTDQTAQLIIGGIGSAFTALLAYLTLRQSGKNALKTEIVVQKTEAIETKTTEIGTNVDGNLSKVTIELAKTKEQLESMSKIVTQLVERGAADSEEKRVDKLENGHPIKVEMVNTPKDPANVTNIEPTK